VDCSTPTRSSRSSSATWAKRCPSWSTAWTRRSSDRATNRPPSKTPFVSHFYITTSGHFSTPALLCALLELGIERILFSIDWPFVENLPGMQWMDTVPLSAEDKQKMFNGNARRLLKI